MLLCLDVGNTHIFGGIFAGDQLAQQFRYPSRYCTSDELGIFLKSYLREIGIDPSHINAVSYCSVVPSLDYSIRSAFIKYFSLEPFVLRAGVKTGLQIKYKNPSEVGSDRIANAMAALAHYPQKNIMIVDLGTATTIQAISAAGAFLGGSIVPGLQMQMAALNEQTANLPRVQIIKPNVALGQSTAANIQSGLYFGQRGAIIEIIRALNTEMFPNTPPVIIGTGGFSHLYENLFDAIYPDLILQGLRIAYEKNH